jgi:competence protein ComEC
MGDSSRYSLWREGYAHIGSPYINAVVISHGDMDHKGGLHHLPSSAAFSGMVVVSAYEDTAALRAFAAHWSSALRFKVISRGDTLASLRDVYIECLWPPDSANAETAFLEAADRNRLSLCFYVKHENTSALLTGDIDTMVTSRLSSRYGYNLHADIVVVPHHGSRGSVDAVFYGYIAPAAAVISCGANNTYGHPSEEVLRLLVMQMAIDVYDTRIDGTVIAESNGEYWAWEK